MLGAAISVELGSLLGYLLFGVLAGKMWRVESNAAIRSLNDGDPAAAVRTLDALLARCRPYPAAYSVYLMNRGIAALRLGHLDEARAIFESIRHAGWFELRKLRRLLPNLLVDLGYVEALAGNLDAAEECQRRAHAMLVSPAITALILDVTIAARRGRLDDAEALMQSKWLAFESSASAIAMKKLRVLRAFVASVRGDRAAVASWLEGVKPLQKGRFSYVGLQWPEFAAFEAAEL